MNSDNGYALTRARPPWPGVLPLTEAAVLLGLEVPALRQRHRRGTLPGFKRAGRQYVILLPAQWTTWSLTYVHPVEAKVEPGLHHSLTGANSPPSRSPGGWTTAPALEALRREWLRRLEVETAEKAYWRDVALTAATELEAARRAVHLLTEQRASPEHKTLPAVHPVQPAWWWHNPLRRLASWLLRPSSPQSSLAPRPSQNS